VTLGDDSFGPWRFVSNFHYKFQARLGTTNRDP
jgi:hypothetical protein